MHHLLQVWAEGVDLTLELPTSVCIFFILGVLCNKKFKKLLNNSLFFFCYKEMGETALHMAILREMGDSLHLVDFLVQNMSSSGLDKPTLLVQDHLGWFLT